MSKITKWIVAALVILVPIAYFVTWGWKNVGTNDSAVAINKLTGQYEKYGVGTHFLPSSIYDFHKMTTDRLVQMEMELDFKTRDGNDIRQKLIISMMVKSASLANIIKNVSLDQDGIEEVFVYAGVRSRARDILGDCVTKEYYDTAFRYAKAEEATDELNKLLEPFGVFVEKLQLGDYIFLDEEYRKAVNKRKDYEQLREAKNEELKARILFYASERERISGDNKKQIAQADGEYDRAVKDADALYNANISLAEARIREADNFYSYMAERAKAFEGKGGRNKLLLTIAEVLKNTPKILVSSEGGGGNGDVNLRTLSMDKLIETYGKMGLAKGGQGQEGTTEGKPSAPESKELKRRN